MNYIDRYSFCISYPPVYFKVKTNPLLFRHLDFKREMIEAFYEKGLPGDKFNEIIKSSGAMISGSFLLKVLTNANFQSKDIDVYSSGVYSFAYFENGHNCNIETTKFAHQMYIKELFHCNWMNDVRDLRGEYKNLNAFHVRQFQYTDINSGIEPYDIPNNQKVYIDDVAIHPNNPSDPNDPNNPALLDVNEERTEQAKKVDKRVVLSFLETFDYDFLKLAYDGERLYIYDLESVIHKKCEFNILKHYYPFFSKLNYISQKIYYINSCAARLKKYTNRGYSVLPETTHPKTSEQTLFEKIFQYCLICPENRFNTNTRDLGGILHEYTILRCLGYDCNRTLTRIYDEMIVPDMEKHNIAYDENFFPIVDSNNGDNSNSSDSLNGCPVPRKKKKK